MGRRRPVRPPSWHLRRRGAPRVQLGPPRGGPMVDTAYNTAHSSTQPTIRRQLNRREGHDHGAPPMSWFSRRKARPASARSERKAQLEALAEWAASRRGVEVFVEPKTPVTPVSMLLVASDGEFTRRAIGSP